LRVSYSFGMDVSQLDVTVRIAAITVLVLLASLLLARSQPTRLAGWFAPLGICLSGFLIGNTPDPSLRPHGALAVTAHVASGYAALCLWWFCLASFDHHFRPRRFVLAGGVAWIVLASAARGLLGPSLAYPSLSLALGALGLAMMSHLVWRIIRDFRGDLIEGRRTARIQVTLFLAAQLTAEFVKEFAFGSDWRPQVFTIGQNAGLLVFGVWLTGILLRPESAPSVARLASAEPIRPASDQPKDEEAELAFRLAKLVEVERVHLDPGVTLDAFVTRMGASERAVRHLINHRLGYDHFRAFLNAHRVEEARRLLADPRRDGVKMIVIAAESGFASLASFNRAFREIEGRSPTDYRRARNVSPEHSAAQPQKLGSEELSVGF
jgi:AraC-like DNA-binding protein